MTAFTAEHELKVQLANAQLHLETCEGRARSQIELALRDRSAAREWRRSAAREWRRLVAHYQNALSAANQKRSLPPGKRGRVPIKEATPAQVEGFKAFVREIFLKHPKGGNDAYTKIRAELGNPTLQGGRIKHAVLKTWRKALRQELA